MRWYHVGIKVRDVDASIRFYREVMGLDIVDSMEFHGKRFVFVGNDTIQIEMEQAKPGDTQADPVNMTGLNHFSVVVDDIHGFVKDARSRGANVLNDPLHPRPDRLTSFMKDPDGVLIQVIQYV
ncbi:MAG: VOC family protein [Spirochaetes bacterium]|nr:VOC family protein [Spirochaetota bacterium]